MAGNGEELREVLVDLRAEHDDLDALVAPLTAEDRVRPTPSAGWSIGDQIGHLWYFDRAAAMAAGDPDAFATHLDSLLAAAGQPGADLDAVTLGAARAMGAVELLGAWRTAQRDLLETAARVTGDDRIPWYGPPMRPVTFFAARLMETWAHGQDVADALGAERTPTNRLRWIADLGVRTRGWAYVSRELAAPPEAPSIELRAPDGSTWRWGPADGDDRIAGTAEAFCLVVTQRRHLDDVELHADGPAAREWMAIAQAFAGPPTDGPAPAARLGGLRR